MGAFAAFLKPIAQQVIGSGLGMGIGSLVAKQNDQRQYEQQEKLSRLGLHMDKQRMDYQNEKQLEMWKNTSYPAQLAMMKEAGLSPGLMYGQGGGGGTTVGGGMPSGGQGNAPSGGGEIMGMLQMRSQEAQIELMKAQAEKTKVEAEKIGGVDTELGKTQIQSLTQGIENQKAVKKLTEMQSRITDLQGDLMADTFQEQVSTIGLQAQINNETFRRMVRENWIDQETANTRIKIADAQLFNTWADTALKKANKAGTEQQIAESKARVQQAWQTISQGWGNLVVNQGNMDTNAKNAMVNDLRLKFDKEIRDISESTKLTVESVVEIVKGILRAK